MKRTLALLLTLMLAAGTVASCGDKKEETKNPESTVTDNVGAETEGNADNETNVDTSAYTTLGIIDSIYNQKAPAFMTMSIPVDLADADAVKMYLGLEDASKIAEASVTESMMGAQAYSLVIARVAEGQDAKAVAQEMKNGIDPRKWICVAADDIKYTTAGDLVCFCMISTDFKEDFTADDAVNAFGKIISGEAQYVETTVGTLPEEGIDEMPEMPDTEEAPEEEKEDAKAEDKKEETAKPAEKPAEKPADTQKPAEKPAEKPADTPAAAPEEVPNDVPAAEPENVPAETPEVQPEEIPVVQPEEAPVEIPEEAPAETPAQSALSPEEIINKMYEVKMPEFMLGTIPVDLSDKDACSTYLGLKDASKIVNAVVSEPMIGAQAYSLVVAKVAPGQDANAVANEMKSGIDPRKWVCVEADDIKVTVAGDLICFCMISTDFADQFTAQDAMDAFRSVAK